MKFTPDPEIQFGTVAEIKAFQDRRLAETVGYLAGNSPFYMRLFVEKGIDPETIASVEDLQRIPTVSKDDLQKYSRDFICVPEDDIVDYVTTSGTLGDPVTFALTDADLDRLAYNEWLSFSTAGCSRSDIMQLMTTIDRRFMAGLAYFLGARKMGMGIVRVGNGIPELQWDTIRRVRPDCCMVVPSFLMKLVGYARENGIDYRGSSLRKAICIGEALRDPDTFGLSTLGRRIHEVWPELELYSTYASTEMQSSFTECHCHCGCHIPVDLIIVELLDRDGNHVPDGQPGEVTVTTLGVEGMPLLRFRTGDICRMYDEPCSCGRNSPRLSSVIGRRSQMVKFKGTTLYPPALFDVLDSIPEIINYIVEVYTNDLGTDEVLVRIGCEDQSDAFLKKVKDMFRSRVRVAPTISFEKADYIAKLQMPPMSRKAVKFIDMR
ncbi:MAG: AMP-binding protein [Bacteroidetes bacterium]|uniref:AMP-binding protein n=1 Tax=Candidatus Cryptobacteroides intestinavium TaxID=2840766 RepID=A0A9D9HIA3_9BACT|nr:AMP-binding protein [Candidatus Cryptobacteroides intestinavium]